ncbi:MAG: PQQ-dependent sugar dehydrogenase [Vicinamibacterales bacterium]
MPRSFPSVSLLARVATYVLVLAGSLTHAPALAQAPQIGVAPVVVGAGPYTFDTAEQHGIRVVVVARGLAHPYSLAFLPDGDALVTERGARLRVVHHAASASEATLDPQPISGLPDMPPFRSGGLQEVAVHPQFAVNHLVYFTYNKAGAAGPAAGQRQSAITVARGRLAGNALTDVEELFVGDWNTGASGSRLVFSRDGFLFITTGSPFGDHAQRLDTVYGKVLRLRDDGRVPPDNPYVGKPGARPEIYSIGHRDQLGLTIHEPTGTLLAAEHGPNGGDEINAILPGRDYGWPSSSFGRNYDGTRVSALPLAPGIEPPILLWIPSIAPTGLAFYTGDRFPAWKGNLFVGSARRGEVPRTGGLERVVFNDKLEELRRETLLGDLRQRIRDVRQGPDGCLYVVTDEDDGVLLRIEPS